MSAVIRKKSPRAPSMPLDEALDRAIKAYDRDRLHPAPSEVFAQNIGYKSANSGAAISAIASLRYFGLVERPSDGMLAITKSVESYKFAPDESMRQARLLEFVRQPALYDELLTKYDLGLPSDANLRYELIQRGFAPAAAESALLSFKRSVDFVGYFDRSDRAPVLATEVQSKQSDLQELTTAVPTAVFANRDTPALLEGEDRIPIRLPGGRRAWLVIPTPFYEADKDRIKAHIDLLLTQEDEGSQP